MTRAPEVSAKDYESLLALVGRLHGTHHPEVFPHLCARELSTLLGADWVSFEHVAPTVPRLWSVTHPGRTYTRRHWETFLRHVDEHPAIGHYRRTGDQNALKISDFVRAGEWHRTNLYQELYRELDCEDQLGVTLGAPDEEFYAVVLCRGTRSFSERDRALLNLVRPHIAQAFANARDLERLARRERLSIEAAEHLGQSAVLLGPNGRVDHLPPRAQRWLRRYFPESTSRNPLPSAVADWIGSYAAARDGEASMLGRPLIRDREGRRLIVRVRAEPEIERHVIVLEEQTILDGAMVRTLGVTSREADVLVELEKGASNEDIAGVLRISPKTVRTHLQRIFNKLGVTNRTAAVARLREIR